MSNWVLPIGFGRVAAVPGTILPSGQASTGYLIGDPKLPPSYQGLATIEESEVYAVADGTIQFASGEIDGDPGGLRVAILHGDGSVTRYNHLSGLAAASTSGNRVSKGTVIGFAGGSGARSLNDQLVALYYERRFLEGDVLMYPFGDEKLNLLFVEGFQWGQGKYF
jgi:hypothetical protein